MTEPAITYFDDFNGPNRYAFLSNFYVGEPIKMFDGRTYMTGEHLFQAFKARGVDAHDKIRTRSTPARAKHYGRSCTLRVDWDQVKYDVMRVTLALKFAPNTKLEQKLLETGDRLLIEGNTWHDTVWGTYEGVGRNWLGTLLTARRAELRAGGEFLPELTSSINSFYNL